MKRLWFFYPENDIALAQGSANFTAPAAAVALRMAGEILPVWMAAAGDRVLCHGINEAWFNEVRTRYGVEADVWNHNEFDFMPTPWGWSAASRRVFEDNGFSADDLPDDGLLERYRQLSHRRTSASFAGMLATRLPWVESGVLEVSDIDELAHILSDGLPHVLKSPWSSSGRGVRFVDAGKADEALRQAVGTIRRQGSVMVEPFVAGRTDFAMLYYVQDGRAHYRGLSVFATDIATGRYVGNIVAAQNVLYNKLSHVIDAARLDILADNTGELLESLIGSSYDGPVGVDFMASADGTVHVAEINLRYTMGFLSLSLGRLVPAGEEYIYEIIRGVDVPPGAIRLTPPSAVMQFVLRPI